MAFILFMLVNAVLIVRPTEVIPGLEDLPLYNAVILGALLTAALPILRQLSPSALAARPITACVVGLLAAIVLSHASHGDPRGAVASGAMFAKLVLYYLLVVTNLRSPDRVRLFLLWVCGLMTVQVSFALMQYYEYIDLDSLRPHRDTETDPVTGEQVKGTPRLCGAGIFHDPNDLCVLMVIGAVVALYVAGERRIGRVRFAAAVSLGVFLWAIPLTYSRGGMLTLMAAATTLAVIRLGPRRGTVLLALALPAVLVAVGGRMTRFDLNNPDDTSQHRLRLWSDGLVATRTSPIFGLGQGTYEDLAGQAAHNSYVEGYAELGLFGGTLFTGAFAYAAWALVRAGRALPACAAPCARCLSRSETEGAGPPRAPPLARLRPFLLAIVAALGVGMLSLSRNYTPPTYLVLALVTAYLQFLGPRSPAAPPRLTRGLALRWIGLSAAFFVTMSLVTSLFVRWH